MRRLFIALGVTLGAAGCGGERAATEAPIALAPAQEPAAGACADLFAQDRLPTYRVEISPAEWAKLQDEFLHPEVREAAGLDVNPWHPIVFRHEGAVVTTAMIRLKGHSSWEQAIALDADPKMQFVVSFDEIDRGGRFHGLRKLGLDMPRADRTFLRQRLALAFLHDLNLPAQCANNARLEINGGYYGLYTNLEHMDEELLERVFPGEDGGDLWEYGRELETNEETSTRARREALYRAATVAELLPLVDLAASLRTWAAEAMLPDIDGYYGGPHNFYLYDHPTRGFLWLSYDLDGTFDVGHFDVDPYLWRRDVQPARHYLVALSDPEWMTRYVDALEDASGAYDPALIEARLRSWASQIASAAAEDPHRPFSMADHAYAVERMSAFVPRRAAFVKDWIICRRGAGEDPDGDGARWCLDCAEGDAAVHPGAGEACGNALDDDCDGWIDEGC